jgi:hypothetical protein
MTLGIQHFRKCADANKGIITIFLDILIKI